jgi:hypothetical protein
MLWLTIAGVTPPLPTHLHGAMLNYAHKQCISPFDRPDRVIGTAITLQAGPLMNGRAVPGRSKRVSFLQGADHFWGPRRVFYKKVKRSGRDDDHSRPTTAEVTSVWSHTSTPPYTLTVCTEKTLLLPPPLTPDWTLLTCDKTDQNILTRHRLTTE